MSSAQAGTGVQLKDPDELTQNDNLGGDMPPDIKLLVLPIPSVPTIYAPDPIHGPGNGPADDQAGCSESAQKCYLSSQCVGRQDPAQPIDYYGCVHLIHVQQENDSTYDYYAEEFIGWGATSDRRLYRFKGRAFAEGHPYQPVQWAPVQDYSTGSCDSSTTYGFEFFGTFSYTPGNCDGKIHRYVDEDIYHVSWISENDAGDSSKRHHNVEGSAVFQVPANVVPYDLSRQWWLYYYD